MGAPRDFDPSKPLIGSDLLEYEDFAACLAGTPLENFRNRRVKYIRAHGHEGDVVYWVKHHDGQSEHWGAQRISYADFRLEKSTDARRRARQSSPLSPPPDPLHAADQPEVPGRLGP